MQTDPNNSHQALFPNSNSAIQGLLLRLLRLSRLKIRRVIARHWE